LIGASPCEASYVRVQSVPLRCTHRKLSPSQKVQGNDDQIERLLSPTAVIEQILTG